MKDPLSDSTPDIPDFVLIREIGRGAFGQVWLARNRATGALRAVKLISRNSAGAVDPAGREVVSVARLESVRHRRHPNLLDIQHIGQTPDYVFLVTDLADNATGTPASDEADYVPATLQQRLSAGPASSQECLDWTIQLLQGLASLHEAGMVHRDVKPANCLFIDGQLKLTDFGLLTEADSHASRIGTQAYMPPDGRMDARADVYAVGLVMYEMLTGRPVERFPQLGDRADCVASDPVSCSLLGVLLDACQPCPEDRYANASAMLAAVQESQIPNTHRAPRWVFPAVAVAALFVAAFFVWKWAQPPDVPQAPPGTNPSRVHVNFVTDPFGATVRLDGEVVVDDDGNPVTTPCTVENLEARLHVVTFCHPDLPDMERTIDFRQRRQIVESWPVLQSETPGLNSPDSLQLDGNLGQD